MTLNEVLKTGAHKIIRKSWEYPDAPMNVRVDSRYSIEEIFAEDWEVYKEPRKVTLYQYLFKQYEGYFMTEETSLEWDVRRNFDKEMELLKTFTREIEY